MANTRPHRTVVVESLQRGSTRVGMEKEFAYELRGLHDIGMSFTPILNSEGVHEDMMY